jgi:MFS transporter, DHA2 family, methylenomycin A resistance protein
VRRVLPRAPRRDDRQRRAPELAVITHAFPEKGEQARAIGIWAGIGSVALPAGPLLGGALVEGASWRAAFLVNVPIVLVAFAVARVPTRWPAR